MTIVWLVRHAIAEDASESGRDADRALTLEGRRRLRLAAKGLDRLQARPVRIFTSPLLRARQTAMGLVEDLAPAARVVECEALAPGGEPRDVVAALNDDAEGGEAVLIGHMPELARLLGELVGGGAGLRVAFKKAGAAQVVFDDVPELGRGTLVALYPAGVLRALRD